MATNNAINLAKCSFRAHQNTSQSIVTEDTVVFNVVEFDEASAYNASTGIYTAPLAGNYFFGSIIGSNANNAYCTIGLTINLSTTVIWDGNLANLVDSYGYSVINVSTFVHLNAGDKASIVFWPNMTATITPDISCFYGFILL